MRRPVRATLRAILSTCSAVLATVLGGALLAPPAGATNDPYFDLQWNLAQIGAADAWTASTGASVKVGIVDTGVDSSHPDLASKLDGTATCLAGNPCIDGAAPDGHGHGTIVSGIVAAVTGNGKGVAGVAPDARLLVAKAVDDQGRGDVGDIINGIHWVVDHGARVVNLSLGDPNFLVTSLLGSPLRPGIEYAWSKGAIPVLASGNDNVGVLDLGSSNYGTLDAVVVGATDRSGSVASYSSPIGNAKWGIVAPGGNGDGQGQDILSTYPGGRYAWVAGTSMAAPHVSAGLALLLARGLNPTAAVQRVLSSADKSVRCGASCAGRLNLAAAASGLSPLPPATPAEPVTAAPVPPTTAQVTTAPPTTATTTTTVPASTTLPTTPDPERRVLVAGPIRPTDPSDGSRAAAFVVALALVSSVWAGLAIRGWRWFTADERW